MTDAFLGGCHRCESGARLDGTEGRRGEWESDFAADWVDTSGCNSEPKTISLTARVSTAALRMFEVRVGPAVYPRPEEAGSVEHSDPGLRRRVIRAVSGSGPTPSGPSA